MTASAIKESSKHRILILIDDELRIKSIVLFLANRGHEVKVARTYPVALDTLEEFQPDVVLISWHLEYADVKTLETDLRNLQILCIVFAEDTSAQTSASLMNSGIENHILAPVSGGSINARIESLYKKGGYPKVKGISSHEKFTVVQPQDLPPGGLIWEKVGNLTSTAEDQVWSTTSKPKEGETAKIYFFKAPQCPVYDDKKNLWKGFENSSIPLIMQERNLSELHSETQEQLEAEAFEFLQKSSPPAENLEIRYKSDIEEMGKGLQPRSGEPLSLKVASDASSILSKAVNMALLETCDSSSSDVFLEIGSLNKVYAMTISTFRFQGYLVFALASDDSLTGTFVAQVAKVIIEKLVNAGERLRLSSGIYDLHFSSRPFLDFAQGSAEFLNIFHHGAAQIAIAYWQIPQVPQLIEAHSAESKDKDLLAIDLQKNIQGDTQLLFDLYLGMEKNQRIILYLKKGTQFSQARFDKLVSHGVKEVYIRNEERDLFFSYCAGIKIFSKI